MCNTVKSSCLVVPSHLFDAGAEIQHSCALLALLRFTTIFGQSLLPGGYLESGLYPTSGISKGSLITGISNPFLFTFCHINDDVEMAHPSTSFIWTSFNHYHILIIEPVFFPTKISLSKRHNGD